MSLSRSHSPACSISQLPLSRSEEAAGLAHTVAGCTFPLPPGAQAQPFCCFSVAGSSVNCPLPAAAGAFWPGYSWRGNVWRVVHMGGITGSHASWGYWGGSTGLALPSHHLEMLLQRARETKAWGGKW